MPSDQAAMARAFELASLHRTHPNPRVGAVIANHGEIVGEGSHQGPGQAHAEVIAIDAARDKARGAELYVSLEPCNHQGRTPPCVDAILEAGLRRVIVGIEDPDERVRGSGISRLRAAGVDVEVWREPDRAVEVDPGYFHHRRTGLPRVLAKFAMTLDGSAAATDGSSQWITSEEARQDAHALRSQVDAVVVGAGTVRADDPRLDVRLEGYSGPQPRPVIIAGRKPLPADALVWSRNPIVVSSKEMDLPGGESIVVAGEDRPDPRSAAAALADKGYLDLLIEGGPMVLGAWWAAGLITLGYAYLGARVGGGGGIQPLGGRFGNIDQATSVEIVDVQSIGPDVRIGFR